MLVLAACSPRNFSGEQVARTYNQSQQLDTSSFHHLVDKLVHEEVQKFMDVHELTDMTSVNEVFSAPDSTGKQHVTERTTTKLRKRSDTSAGAMQKKEEHSQELISKRNNAEKGRADPGAARQHGLPFIGYYGNNGGKERGEG